MDHLLADQGDPPGWFWAFVAGVPSLAIAVAGFFWKARRNTISREEFEELKERSEEMNQRLSDRVGKGDAQAVEVRLKSDSDKVERKAEEAHAAARRIAARLATITAKVESMDNFTQSVEARTKDVETYAHRENHQRRSELNDDRMRLQILMERYNGIDKRLDAIEQNMGKVLEFISELRHRGPT